jgi:hypothetical protein
MFRGTKSFLEDDEIEGSRNWVSDVDAAGVKNFYFKERHTHK